ncbi:MAG: hypothetical protein CM15mV95_370 [Caudoviricetes sp.]|nr:MAG: hypothetical protein CM15mV95_370 [Caudoviricetes sp.]
MADNEHKKSLEAKQILENPVFIDAVNKIRSDLANEWLNSDVKIQNRGKHLYYEKNVGTCCDANPVRHGNW